MRRLCLAFVALLGLAAPAAAGGCCGSWAPAPDLHPVVPVSTYRFDAPPPVSQVYVVNQGPVLSGPGIYAYTNHYVPSFVPSASAYPYVGGCGGYGGCGSSYGGGCGYGGCGQTYSYGCGSCGGAGYGYGAGYGWNGGYTGYPGYGYRHYRANRVWHRHAAPLARTAARPSRGY